MEENLIDHNPLLKKPLLEILSICSDNPEANRDEIEILAEDVWQENYRQSPSVSIDILIRGNALEEKILVDGNPYEGTLEDIQLDENIADDAHVDDLITLTDDGADMLSRYAPQATIFKLFEEHPQYTDVYYAALKACDTEDGEVLSQLEATINAFPQLQPDPQTKQTSVYAQYFIDALESAGAIVWDGAWHITDAGREVLSS